MKLPDTHNVKIVLDTSAFIDDILILKKTAENLDNVIILISDIVYYELKHLKEKGGLVGKKATFALKEIDSYITYSLKNNYKINNYNSSIITVLSSKIDKTLSKILSLDFLNKTDGNDNQILLNLFNNRLQRSILISSDKKLKSIARRRGASCYRSIEGLIKQS